MTIPNLLTIARLLSVPLIVWLIGDGRWAPAFWVFVVSGVSDALDGYLARRFGLESRFGALLDPVADKALLVAIFISLGFAGQLPNWLVIAVVSRDILIVGGVVLSWMLERPIPVRPLMVSKATTAAQIVLAALVLCEAAFVRQFIVVEAIMIWLAAALTLVSAAAYLVGWLRHMSSDEPVPGAPDRSEDRSDSPTQRSKGSRR